jgi:hypothetical protein
MCEPAYTGSYIQILVIIIIIMRLSYRENNHIPQQVGVEMSSSVTHSQALEAHQL